jgi:hypothetical protein
LKGSCPERLAIETAVADEIDSYFAGGESVVAQFFNCSDVHGSHCQTNMI